MRFHWVDTAKAILIFLVILGHCHYTYAPLPGKALIYAFHVPAFLFITGFLMPTDFGTLGISRVFSKWIATFLRAYAFFSTIAIALWWARLSLKTGGLVNPFPAVTAALYGVAGSGNGLVHDDQPLWYFPFLVTSVLGGWVCAKLGRAGWAAALAYAAFALIYHGSRLPWALDIAGVGTLIFLSGHAMRRHYDWVRPIFENSAYALILAVLSGSALVLVSGANGPTNLNGADFGNSGLLYLGGTYCGITMIVGLCSALPPTRIAQLISIETLTIFALHIYLVRILSKLAPTPPASDMGRLGMMIVISLGALLGCMILARLLRPVLNLLVTRKPQAAAGNITA